MKAFIVLFAFAVASAPALARDSAHLICAGYLAAAPGLDNYGFAVQFDESRADDGESRNEMLSTVWVGKLYQGVRFNSNDDFGKNGTILMVAAVGTNTFFFNGTYNIIQSGNSSSSKNYRYKMKLKGKLNTNPADVLSVQNVSTTLNCMDISN